MPHFVEDDITPEPASNVSENASSRSAAPSPQLSPPAITEEEIRGIQETFEGLQETLNTIEDPDEEMRTAIAHLNSYETYFGEVHTLAKLLEDRERSLELSNTLAWILLYTKPESEQDEDARSTLGVIHTAVIAFSTQVNRLALDGDPFPVSRGFPPLQGGEEEARYQSSLTQRLLMELGSADED
jgi:hypothetical protein